MGPAQAEPWCDCRSSRVGGKGQAVPRTLRKRRPTRERGRLARMHCRCVSLSFPAIRPPATLPAGTPRVRPRQSPGTIAGRVGLEGRAGLSREHCGRDAPPGSAGVSPACTAAAYRAERLRWCTRQPRRQKRREPGQSRALARLPVESRWRRRASCAETNAGETPALPGGRPAPVATLPPRDSGPTLPLSVPKTLQFSMPIDSVPGRVPLIRRIRGWVGAGPERPRVDTRGYTNPLLRSSIRMACRGRFLG